MPSLIASLIGKNAPRPVNSHPEIPFNSHVGLELELEGATVEWPDIRGWRREVDGSLRDGMEYVFREPQGGHQAYQSIETMASTLEGLELNNSFRCSTHIHLDVRDMDFAQLERLILAYMMNEGVMFDHCSLERRYSNFCTPFFVNGYLPRLMVNSLGRQPDDHHRIHHLSNWPKYTALNLRPVTSYGSVEFRGSHAMTTKEELLSLTQRTLHLKRLAMENEVSSTEFVERLRAMPLSEMFPSGLMEGYVPDERLQDKGYVSALGVAAGVLGVQGSSYSPPPSLTRPRPNSVPNPMVEPNPIALERYNLHVPGTLRLSELMLLVSTLRRLQGITTPPRLTDFIDWRAYTTSQGFINLMNQCGLRTSNLGI